MKKKFLSVLVSLLMMTAVIPGNAYAAEDTVTDAAGLWITSETTNEQIESAWGENVATIEANDDGSYTVTLLKNISLKKGQTISFGKQFGGDADPLIVLDLNGKTIEGTSIPVGNYANLTIKDSSEGGTGGISYTGDGYFVAINNVGNKMTIEGGNFSCTGAGSASYNAAISTAGGVKTVINGGNFTSNGSGAIMSYGETVINGGNFEGKYGVVSKVNSEGKVGNIIFPEDSTAVVNAQQIAFVSSGSADSAGTIDVKGGTFTSSKVLGTMGDGVDKSSVLNVTGGIHSADPSEYVPENTSFAKFISADGSEVYVLGEDKIKEKAKDSKNGDAISIISGDVTLSDLDEGITVKNEGSGNVVVNDSEIAPGSEILTHKYELVIKNAKDATCTSEGYTGDKVCKICNQTIEKGKVIAKKAHTYKDGKCIVCGSVDPNYISSENTDNENNVTSTDNTSKPNTPDTSDNSNVIIWSLLAVFSTIAMVITVIFYKKRRYIK
ncbi:hypothetical protein [Anaerofustis sp.]|uniref:hypothetical protein n=1 Tax=Anaerofustis sp. TaxID=1872517 RepID=UPI0025C463B9|nr:hypothetical protein [Anaerofustis sp.]